MEEKLYVILGDVVSSRKVELREKLQRSLEDSCQKVNSNFSQDIYAKFKLIKGTDEIGGVLSGFSNLFRILVILEDSIFPQMIRLAVVHDFIDVGLDSKDVTKMDGPAFHRAADYISELKKSDLLLRVSISDNIIDSIIEGEINLIFIRRSHWTKRQHEIVERYEELKSSVKVADEFGIKHQTVTSTLKRADWYKLYPIEKTLNEDLLKYQQRIIQASRS